MILYENVNVIKWLNMPSGQPNKPIKCRICSTEKKSPNSKCPNTSCIMSTPGRHKTIIKKVNKPKIHNKLKPKKLNMIDLPELITDNKTYKIENHEVSYDIDLNYTRIKLAIKKNNRKNTVKSNKEILECVIKKLNKLNDDIKRLEKQLNSHLYSCDNTLHTHNMYNKLGDIKKNMSNSEDILSSCY